MARKSAKSTRKKGDAKKRPAKARKTKGDTKPAKGVPEKEIPPQSDARRARARGMLRRGRAFRENMSVPEIKAAIIEHLSTTGDTFSAAIAAAGIDRSTFYDWKKSDKQFAAMCEEAYDAGDEVLEQELKRRGTRGDLEPVWHQGVICGHVRKRSDGALTFVLQRRERLRAARLEKAAGAAFGMVSLDIAKMPPEVRKVIRAELERQQREEAAKSQAVSR